MDDINDFAVFNEMYKTYLSQKPAHTTFDAEALAAECAKRGIDPAGPHVRYAVLGA